MFCYKHHESRIRETEARSTLRFGIGRFNTREEVEKAVRLLSESTSRVARL